jgi:hypothetical protein
MFPVRFPPRRADRVRHRVSGERALNNRPAQIHRAAQGGRPRNADGLTNPDPSRTDDFHAPMSKVSI